MIIILLFYCLPFDHLWPNNFKGTQIIIFWSSPFSKYFLFFIFYILFFIYYFLNINFFFFHSIFFFFFSTTFISYSSPSSSFLTLSWQLSIVLILLPTLNHCIFSHLKCGSWVRVCVCFFFLINYPPFLSHLQLPPQHFLHRPSLNYPNGLCLWAWNVSAYSNSLLVLTLLSFFFRQFEDQATYLGHFFFG